MNNKIIIWIIGIIFSLCSFISFDNNELPKYAEKKALRVFENLWPKKVVRPESIAIQGNEMPELVNLKRVELYRLLSEEENINGYMFLCAAPSRHDYFDLLVIFQPDLTIATIEVLVYREEYGGEIGSRRWLKQFINKGSKDAITVNQDIQGISGATISVNSATKTIKNLTLFIHRLKDEELLSRKNQ